MPPAAPADPPPDGAARPDRPTPSSGATAVGGAAPSGRTAAPRRVRVTAMSGQRRPGTPVRPARGVASRDLDEQTVLGDVYLRGLLRDQRRLAIGVLVALGLALGLLPALFAFAPDLAATRVPRLGVSLPWLVLGVAVYPALVLLARAYVRGAERTERDFTDLLSGRPVGRDRPRRLRRARRRRAGEPPAGRP